MPFALSKQKKIILRNYINLQTIPVSGSNILNRIDGKKNFKNYFRIALENKEGCFTIIDKYSNKFIGSTRYYSLNEKDRSVRIGYTFFTPEYWGTPANPQIKKLMLDYIFQYIDKVYFDIGKENYRSQKSIEKLGGKKQLTEAKDSLIYLIDKKNWMLTQSTPRKF